MTRALFLIALLTASPAMGWQGPDLILTEHTYDGPVTRTGKLTFIQYAVPTSRIEWVDTSTDGIFRNGYES